MCFIYLFIGLFSYGTGVASAVYAIGFIGNLVVPKTIDSGPPTTLASALLIDLVLIALFAVQHSVMARPRIKRWSSRFVPAPIVRSLYVLLSGLALGLLCWQWRAIPGAVWHVTNDSGRLLLNGLYLLGWAISLSSTFMINHWEMFGLKQVHYFLRGKPIDDEPFQTGWFYRFVRHPIMLGFLIAFWAAPTMSVGHLLLAVGMSAYIFLGIALEERDLMDLLGQVYISYAAQVPRIFPRLRRKRSIALDAHPVSASHGRHEPR